MGLCAPGTTLIFKTEKKPWQQNPDNNLLKIFRSLTEKLQGINPMGLCDPWAYTYLRNWKPTHLNYQNQLDESGKIEFNPVNPLMMKIGIIKPAP